MMYDTNLAIFKWYIFNYLDIVVIMTKSILFSYKGIQIEYADNHVRQTLQTFNGDEFAHAILAKL